MVLSRASIFSVANSIQRFLYILYIDPISNTQDHERYSSGCQSSKER